METIIIKSLKIKSEKQYSEKTWSYCVIRWNQGNYFTKSFAMFAGENISLINAKNMIQINSTATLSPSFSIQFWDYDQYIKIAEIFVSNKDLKPNDKRLTFEIMDIFGFNITVMIDYENKAITPMEKNTLGNRPMSQRGITTQKQLLQKNKFNLKGNLRDTISPHRINPQTSQRWKLLNMNNPGKLKL